MEEEIVIEEKAVKQKTIETNVKDVVGLLPLITIIVFTLGLLKLFFYYKHF